MEQKKIYKKTFMFRKLKIIFKREKIEKISIESRGEGKCLEIILNELKIYSISCH
jgi:hypothetical protein